MIEDAERAETDAGELAGLMRDSAAAFAAGISGTERLRTRSGSDIDFSRDIWRQMADLGWTGAVVAEADGGYQVGLRALCGIAEELGEALLHEPFVPSIIFATGLLARSENSGLKARVLPAILSGGLVPAVAWQEQSGIFDPSRVETSAVRRGDDILLSGMKSFVRPVAGVDGFLVSAASDGGLGLYWLASDAEGLAISTAREADGGLIGTLSLDRVRCSVADVIAGPGTGAALLTAALDKALIVASAELLGLMRGTLRRTLDYLRTRVQFGRAIGSFQALQHRAADLHIACELAAVAVTVAIDELEQDVDGDAAKRGALASRAKARATDAALQIARDSIQLHGGIGFTDEYDIGLRLKRTLALAAWLGNGSMHRRRYASLALPEIRA